MWLLVVLAFYAWWTSWLLMPGNAAVVLQHWPIALTMLFRSYVAGATPMGGGTVAFPILVLAFGLPATLGRDFSFAIQSVGMTSAAVFILTRRQRLAWSMLAGALTGSLLGLPLGILAVAPQVPTIWVKMVFAVCWAAFGLLHLVRLDDLMATAGNAGGDGRRQFGLGIAAGFLAGATIVAVTGVGIDMLVYSLLVLSCRVDPKIAIPTSVVAMAFNSLLGTAIKLSITGLEAGVWENWLAAAPVVALGAPLGAFAVAFLGRRITLLFVALLCVVQFVWACYHDRADLGSAGLLAAVAAVAAGVFALDRLRIWGRGRLDSPGPSPL